MLIVGKKVLFHEPYRPPQVQWGSIDVIVDVGEERSRPERNRSGVRARFGDFITP
jgi:hypothetical protein